jgi:hypothetical protein
MKVKAKLIVHDHAVDEFNHQDLSPGKIYHVVGINDESFRVVDDKGEPILYSKKLFDVVDSKIPDHWVTKKYEDDEYYIDPPEFSEPGFYEKYFDGVKSAVKIFDRYLKLNAIKIEKKY